MLHLPNAEYITSLREPKTTSAIQELSATATVHCHIPPVVYPSCNHVDDLPNIIQQNVQMTTLEKSTSLHAFFSLPGTPYWQEI